MGDVAIWVVLALIVVVGAGTVIDRKRAHKRLQRRMTRDGWRLGRLENELTRTRRELYAALARERLRDAGREAKLEVGFKAEWNEDAFLWDLFEGSLDGTYFEAGAYDGVRLSVTYAFESVGWTGTLVEPIERRAKECEQNRPNSRVVHAAIVAEPTDEGVDLTFVPDNEMLSHVEQEGMGVASLETIEREEAETSHHRVPAATLKELWAEPIDFAVLDLEGGEAPALLGAPWGERVPRVLLVEDNTMGHDEGLRSLVEMGGYACVGLVGSNLVFVDEEEQELLARARLLLARTSWPANIPADPAQEAFDR